MATSIFSIYTFVSGCFNKPAWSWMVCSLSSTTAWNKITEGKVVSKLPPEKQRWWRTLPRDAVLLCLWGKAISSFLWTCRGKGEGLKSRSCKIGSFLPPLASEVSLLLSVEHSLSFLNQHLSWTIHPQLSCSWWTWHLKPPLPGPYYQSTVTAWQQHFTTYSNWHVFLIPLWVHQRLPVPGSAQLGGSASCCGSSWTWLLTMWGRLRSVLRVFILEPRLREADIWKSCLVLHHHLHGDLEAQGVSWNPTSTPHILLAKASRTADAQVKVEGNVFHCQWGELQRCMAKGVIQEEWRMVGNNSVYHRLTTGGWYSYQMAAIVVIRALIKLNPYASVFLVLKQSCIAVVIKQNLIM